MMDALRFHMPSPPLLFGRRRWKAQCASFKRWLTTRSYPRRGLLSFWDDGFIRMFVRPYVELGRSRNVGMVGGRQRGRFRGIDVDAFTATGHHARACVFFEHYEDEAALFASLDSAIERTKRALLDRPA